MTMQGAFLPSSVSLNKYYNTYNKLPIEATVNFDAEPFHWHDEMEIICVIQGNLEVQVNNKHYLLKQDDIIIINDEDVHCIYSRDDSMAFISLHIDLRYVEVAMANISYILFSYDTMKNTSENAPALCRVRSKIARIILELKDKRKLYESRILLQVTSLLNILINNFNFTRKDPESYKSIEQFERIWNILNYIFNNYRKKITVRDIAKHVHISESYVSHCIKDNTDMSFEDLLNYARSDLATRMLITTNMSITRVSYECGFSDPKYFNKYFQKFFECSPAEYRNKNKSQTGISSATETKDAINYDDFLMNKLREYISEEQIIDSSKDFTSLDVDFTEDLDYRRQLVPYWKEYIDVGDASVLLNDNVQRLMFDIQDDIGFSHIRIHNLLGNNFSSETQDWGTYNWNTANKILDFIKALKAYPIIVVPVGNTPPVNLYQLLVDNTSFKAEPSLVNLAKNCLNRYEADYINRWIFVNHKDCEPASGSDTHLLYDTAVMAPYFIHNILHPVHAGIAKRFTSLYDSAELGLFMGGSGICTANGLRKPLYHAYTFLSRLGDIVLSEGNNHIITRQGDNIQILLYNLPELARNHPIWDIIVESNKRYADFAQDDVINFHININNLSGDDYIIEQCKLDRENGSIFDKFVQQEAVKYLSAKETAQVNNACFPQIKISLASSCKKWSIRSCLVPNTVEFIKIIHCDK